MAHAPLWRLLAAAAVAVLAAYVIAQGGKL
jgi:hypothetical protein